jgi:uncharacterized protein YsxB (DUF464 family)
MIRVRIEIDETTREYVGLTEEEQQVLLNNFEDLKHNLEQQIKTHLQSVLLNLKNIKEEIEK